MGGARRWSSAWEVGMGEEGRGELRVVSEADPRVSCRTGHIQDIIVSAAQCGGIQGLSSSFRDQTHAPCIRSVES